MKAMLQFFGILCAHQHTSWPQTDKDGTYTRCLDCGARLEHTLLLKSTATMGHKEVA